MRLDRDTEWLFPIESIIGDVLFVKGLPLKKVSFLDDGRFSIRVNLVNKILKFTDKIYYNHWKVKHSLLELIKLPK